MFIEELRIQFIWEQSRLIYPCIAISLHDLLWKQCPVKDFRQKYTDISRSLWPPPLKKTLIQGNVTFTKSTIYENVSLIAIQIAIYLTFKNNIFIIRVLIVLVFCFCFWLKIRCFERLGYIDGIPGSNPFIRNYRVIPYQKRKSAKDQITNTSTVEIGWLLR